MRPRIRAAALASQTRYAAMALLWLALFAYAGRPLLTTAAAAGFSRAAAWSSLLGLALLPLLSFYRRLNWTGYAVMAVFSTLLVLVVVSDLLRALYHLARWAVAAQTWPLLDPRAVSITIIGTTAVLSLIGLVQARCPRLRRVSIAIDGLPEELEGYRIVQWSDVHVGPTIQRRFVQSLVERTNALAPDAVAITGDLVDGHLDDLREHVQPMRDLRTRDGVFYVTGNHEYYWQAGEWCPALQSLGLDFLKNEHRTIERGDAKIVFAGVTDPVGRGAHKQDLPKALEGAPLNAVTVLLSHRPQTAGAASSAGVDVQLSGHTHGGQFFPFNLVIHKFQPIVAGLHRVGRTWLYVNRGTGYWGPPTRLAVGGEITLIELTAARAA